MLICCLTFLCAFEALANHPISGFNEHSNDYPALKKKSELKNSETKKSTVLSVGIFSGSSQCLSGNNFDFNSTSTISSGSITNQYWDFGDGKNATGSSVSHSYFTAGTYQVKLIVTSDLGCIDSLVKTVTVFPQPLANFVIPANQCLTGNVFSFNSNASIGSGGSIRTQTWNFGDGSTSNGINVTHSFSSAGKFPVNLQVISDNGCIDFVTDTITVFPSPSISVSNLASVCVGNNLSFSSTTLGGLPPYQYSWSGPNSFNSNIANPSISNITSNASGNYSVSVIDSNACTATTSTTVTVKPLPIVSPITGPIGGCVGSNITLTNTTANGVWSSSNPAVATINASTGLVNFLSVGSTNILYDVTVNGCSSSVSTSIIANSVTLHPDIIECNLGITHFTASDTYYGVTYSNSNPGNTYLWSFTGGPFSFQGSSSANSAYPSVQLDRGNAYTVRLQFTSNGVSCIAQQKVYKNTVAADTILGSHDTTICSNSSPISLVAAVSAVTNSFQWTSTGTGTFSNNSSLYTSYTPSAADKLAGYLKIYFIASSNINATGSCGSAYGKDSMILRIYPPNMASNSSQTICSNSTINFTPISSIPGSFYSWSSSVSNGTVYGNSTSGTGNINDSLVNGSNTNDATLVYNITPFAFTPSHATCTGNPFNYTVLIKPKPALVINSPGSICTGNNSNIQFNSTISGSSYTWNSKVLNGSVNGNSNNLIAGSNNTINDILNNLFTSNAKVRYYVNTISSAGCSGSDSTYLIIYANPSQSNAGPDQNICNISSTVMSANIPAVGTGKWDQLSGPTQVNFGSINSPFSTVSGLISGTYQFIWSISNGPCSVSMDTVQLNIFPESIGGLISSNATVCEGSNSNTLNLTAYTGNILNWESSTDGGLTWTTINNTRPNYTYNNLIRTTLFRALVQSGNCSFAYSQTATISVSASTNAGSVTSDTSVCITSNSGVLNLSHFTGSILRWEYSTDAGASWPTINNNSNTYSYNNLNTTTWYRAVVQNGICNAINSNYVTVTVSPQSIAGSVSSDATVCANANSGILSLTGNTGNILNWESSIDNGTSWTTIHQSGNQYTYTNLDNSTQFRAIIQSGSCPSVTTNAASINVLQPVTPANAGADQILCNNNIATLSANSPIVGTGNWTALATNPTAVNIINPADPNTLVSGLTIGTYHFEWKVSNGNCFVSKDTVAIKINAQTIPGTASGSTTVCKNFNSGNIQLNGYIGNIIHWESSIDNGNNWIPIANTSNILSYTNISSTTLFRALVQSGSCTPLYSNNAIITALSAVSVANAGVDQAICNVTDLTLAATVPTSGTGTWTALNSNPSVVSFTNIYDANTTAYGLVSGTYQFVWTVDNSVCANSKDTVQVIVSPLSVPGILSADATICSSSNNGTLNLSGYSSTILQWESSTNGTNWNTIPNTTNTQNYSNLTSSTYYRASVKNGSCPALYSNQIRITVSPATTIADAGPDTTLINGFSSYKLEGNTPTNGVGVWTIIPPYGPSNLIFTDPYDPTATIRKLTYNFADSTVTPIIPPSDGVYHLKWTITNAVCPPSESEMVVTVQPPTNPGFVGIDTIACAGINSGFISVKAYFGNILQWEDSSAQLTNWHVIDRTIGSNQDTVHFENLLTTTYYRALVKNGVGLSLYSGIAATVTILDAVTTADAGKDSSICNTSSIQLYGNRPSSGTGTWSVVPGGPTTPVLSNNKDPQAIVTNLTIGTYQFVWTISNNSCTNSIDTVTITIDAPTIPGTIISSNTVCANNNFGTLHINGFAGSIVAGNYSLDNGLTWLPVANTANKTSFDYTNLPFTTKFRAEVKNGSCPSLYTNEVTITVLQPVTIANAGTDQKLCAQSSTTLEANTAIIGTGFWTSLSTNPSTVTFSNPYDPNSTVSGLVTGSYQFVWTISNVLCANSKDTVQVFVYAPTVSGLVTADAVVCANNNINTLTLTGFTGDIVQWESSINNAASWDIINNKNSTYQYLNLTTTTKYRVLVQNNICPSIYSNDLLIQVLQPVTIANAGSDQKICNQVSTHLAANTALSGSGYWTSSISNPSTVSFNNNSDPNTLVSGLIPGTYQFIWTITNTLCNSSVDTVQIVVYPYTVAGNLVADNFVCADSNSGKLQLSGNNGLIIHWEFSTDNGNNWNTISSIVNTYTYSNLITNTKFRVLVQNGPCNSSYSNEVNITVHPISNPGLLVASDTMVCASYNSGNIQLNGYTGAILHWELSEDNGKNWSIINNAGNNYQFTNLTKPSLFRVLVQSGVCSSIYSNAVSISINQPTVAGSISGNKIVCLNSNSGTIELTGNTGNILHWESSIDDAVSWTSISNNSNTLNYQQLSTNTLYRALIQNGVCALQYTNTAKINVVEPVTIANAGTNQVICNLNTSIQLQANTPTIGQGIWTMVSGPTNLYFNDATNPVTTVNGLEPGTYNLKWTIDNGVCASSSSVVSIIVDKLKADFGLSAINNCGSTTYNFLDASKALYGIANWKWSTAPLDTTNTKNFSKTYSLAGQNKVSLTIQSNTGCSSTTNVNFQVKVYSVPKVNINAINEACKNQLMQLSSNTNSKDSIFNLLWNLGNGINSKDSVVTVQYFSDGKYTVKLMVSTVNNCYDSTYKSIIIHPLPAIQVSSDNFVCKGDTAILLASGAISYIWMDQQNNIVCNACDSIRISPIATTHYNIVGYNQFGCSDITNTIVRVVQPFKVQANLIDTLCVGSSINLKVSGADNYTWLSTPGLSNYYSNDPVASPKITSTYTVIGHDNHACFSDTANIKLVVGEPSYFSLANDTSVQAGVPFMLIPASNNLSNVVRWKWSGNASFTCDNCQTTIAKVSNDADIICTATNIFGCNTTDTISIKTFCPNSEIFIPNAFTPDADGINDILYVQGSGIKIIKNLRIYSRWGELVFEKTNFLPNDPSNGWDGKIRGKAASQDVFVYICEAICEKGIPAIFKGNVAVLK